MTSTNKLFRKHLKESFGIQEVSLSKGTSKTLDMIWDALLEKMAMIISQKYHYRRKITPDIIYEIIDSRTYSHNIWDFIVSTNNSTKNETLDGQAQQKE